MNDFRKCLVCDAQITSMHLGMDICRACASFFKRAKMTGAQYPCRQGTHQCIVSIENKFTCRSCRFDKCLSIGIIYDGPMRERVKATIPLLERVSKEFKSMIARRHSKELEFILKCDGRVQIPHPREKIFMVPVNASMELLTIAISETLIFFENSFISFNQLTKQEKELIFKDYLPKIGLVISYYLTTKFFGNAYNKLMSSVCTCYDSEVSIDFFYPEDNENKDFFESSIRSHTDEHLSLFMPQLNRSQLTEKEFHALAALVMTEHEATISEEAEKMIADIRQEIFHDLQSYYQNEMGLSDYSMRIGHLMSLNHTYQECHSLHKVLIRYYTTFFDMYMTEQYMKVVSMY